MLLFIFDAFTLLICKKNVAIYALLRCKIFSLKIWLCKIFDKFHVCKQTNKYLKHWFMSLGLKWSLSNMILQPKSQRGGGAGGWSKLFWYTSHSKRQHEVIFERLVDLRRDIIDRDKWAHSHKILHVEYNSDQPTITREVQSHFNLKSTTWSGKHFYKYWKICEHCPSQVS